jgi:hypothetical protein
MTVIEAQDREPLVFDDHGPIAVTVGPIEGNYYRLHEALEDRAVKINNARVAAARFQSGELHRVEGAANVEPFAVSLCLKKVVGGELRQGEIVGGKEEDVPIGVVNGWGHRKVKPIFERLLKISGMEEKKTVEQIDKEIERLKRMRVEVEKGTSDPKGPPKDTPLTSD